MAASTHNFSHAEKTIKTVLALLVGLCGLISIGLAIHFLYKQQTILSHAWHQSQEKTGQTADFIAGIIAELEPAVAHLKDQLNAGTINRSSVAAELKNKKVALSGLGVSFQQSGKAVYYVETNGEQKMVELNLATMGDSMLAAADTGKISLATDPSTGEKTLVYATHWHDGIVFATLSIAHIRHILATLYLGKSGYWFVTDAQGAFLIHPDQSLIEQHKSVKDLGQAHEVVKKSLEQAAITGKQSHRYHNEVTQAPSWLFVQRIGSSDLFLAGVFDTHELPLDADFYRHSLMRLLVFFLLTCMGAALLWPALYNKPTNNHLWLASSTVAILLAMGIALSWKLATWYPYYKEQGIMVSNKAQLYKLLDSFEKHTSPESEDSQSPSLDKESFEKLLRFRYKQGGYVPTGMLINDIKFISQDQIEFVGYVWQRYFDGIHDGLTRGFILPQISDKPTINEISRTKIEKAEIIIWQVRAHLNQNFEYNRYPFDVKDIQIQLRHKDFSKKIILVPDLDAYRIINPTALPAIGQDINVSNWRLLKSYFEFEQQKSNTNYGLYAYGPFGIYQEISQTDSPELHLSVVAGRNLLDTIITDLLALCVIAVILFVLLLTYFSEGFEMLLETCGAAFFSTVFAQIQFRAKIPSHEFVYFEIFYLTLYLAIMLILVTTLIHLFHSHISWINYRKNIITKLLYWPFILGIIFAVTVVYLY